MRANGVNTKIKYNQVANYIYLDTQVNKAIRDDAPNIYFGKVLDQCNTKNVVIGNITDCDRLKQNLEQNAVPETVVNMTVKDYDKFLEQRRYLMAKLIEKYYKKL